MSRILHGPAPFKLAVFGANIAGGTNLTYAAGPPSVTWDESLRIAQAADTAGFDALIPVARWKNMGASDQPDRHRTFETFTWAAGLAAVTRNLDLFATVHVPMTHPLTAAKMAATVDHIAGGRFGLNVVAGWNALEFAMFGLEQEEHDERYARADEWMTFVQQAWANDHPFDFDGRFYSGRAVFSQPPPLAAPAPVVMSAGGSPAGRSFAAKHANINFIILPEQPLIAPTVQALKSDAYHSTGRNILVFGAVHIVCSDTEAEARALYHYAVHEQGDWQAAATALSLLVPNSQSADYDRAGMGAAIIGGFFATPLVGTPEQVVQSMSDIAAAGVDGVAVSWIDYEEGISRYARDLYPLMVEAGLRV